MPCQYRGICIAWIRRFFVLRLQQIPIALFGPIEMVACGAKQSVVPILEQFRTLADGASKFKHCVLEMG
jgi:hypothetical protein